MAKNWFLETGSAYGLSIESRYSNYASRLSLEDDEAIDDAVEAMEIAEAQDDVDEAVVNVEKAEDALDELQDASDEVTEAMGAPEENVEVNGELEPNVKIEVDSDQEVTVEVAQEALYKVNEKLGAVRQFTKCRPARMPSFESISTSPVRALKLAHEGISEMGRAIVEFIKKMWGKIKEFFSNLWKKIKGFFAGYKKKLEAMKEKVKALKDGATREEKFDEDAIKSWAEGHCCLSIHNNKNGLNGLITYYRDSLDKTKKAMGEIKNLTKSIENEIKSVDRAIKDAENKYKEAYDNDKGKEGAKKAAGERARNAVKGTAFNTDTDNKYEFKDASDSAGKKTIKLDDDLKRTFNTLFNISKDDIKGKASYDDEQLKDLELDDKNPLGLFITGANSLEFYFINSEKFSDWEKDSKENKVPSVESKPMKLEMTENFKSSLGVDKLFPSTFSSNDKSTLVDGLSKAMNTIGDSITQGDLTERLLDDNMKVINLFNSQVNKLSGHSTLQSEAVKEVFKSIKEASTAYTGLLKSMLTASSKEPVACINEYLAYCGKFVTVYKNPESSK